MKGMGGSQHGAPAAQRPDGWNQAASLGLYTAATGPWIGQFKRATFGTDSVIAQATLVTHSGSVLVSSRERLLGIVMTFESESARSSLCFG